MPLSQPFNLGSPKQLQEILFEKLGLPVVRKTPKGQPSTAEDVLHELAADYELPESDPGTPLSSRSCARLTPTSWPTRSTPDTGRVHTSYHQAVAATGQTFIAGPEPAEHPDPD